jgi:hypothetical protein
VSAPEGQKTRWVSDVSYWVSIGAGLSILILSIRGKLNANWGAALGVFLIFLGLNGFTSLRIARLEEAIKKMQAQRDKRT